MLLLLQLLFAIITYIQGIFILYFVYGFGTYLVVKKLYKRIVFKVTAVVFMILSVSVQ